MCGICGILSNRPVAEETVRAMMDKLAHRGPDDDGLFVEGPVGLGHRRLSIIDLDSGRQPISNEDDTIWIVFNGEIYNYQSLRPDLINRGHRFKTNSDTETILHLYEEYGVDCLQKLRGMFAFTIWDKRKRRIFAARDRLGQKPFYYSQRGDEFLFASEIKSLLAADPSLAEIDLAAVDEYLTLRLVPAPLSMFRDVRKLPPGHYLTFGADEGLRIERYWDLDYGPKLAGSDEDLIQELEQRLVEAIRLHLVSDVPVGAFMSGGLDSTLIVALLRKYKLADELQTFSVGLPYGKYDEAPSARLMAERYETRHHEEEIRPSLLDSLPRVVQQLDEPSDTLPICVDLIAQMARRHVKVVLGGDGGDELFGGYDRYFGNRAANYYSKIPYAIRRYMIQPVLGLLPEGSWYKSAGHQAKWLHRLSFADGGARYLKSLGYFYLREPYKSSLYGPAMSSSGNGFDPGNLMGSAFDRHSADDIVDRMLYADCHSRLPDHPVMIQDRMTMAHGLEARNPFMDHEVAEFSARLPSRMKVRGRTLRYIQVKLAQRYLPQELMSRKKQGFQSALPYLLRDELNVLYSMFLGNSVIGQAGILNQAAVDGLLQEHREKKADHSQRLWLMVNLEVWYRMFIAGQSRATVESYIRENSGG